MPVAEEKKISMPKDVQEAFSQAFGRETRSLFASLNGTDGWNKEGLHKAVLSKAADAPPSGSKLGIGIVQHPFDFAVAKQFLLGNEVHSACIEAKVEAAFGLGYLDSQKVTQDDQRAENVAIAMGGPPPKERTIFQESKVDIALNPLCEISWADVLGSFARDLMSTHNAWIEVVRNRRDHSIEGLHWTPCENCWYFVEKDGFTKHAVVRDAVGEKRLALFGDFKSFRRRNASYARDQNESGRYSEMIHLKIPSSLSRHYGVATWLSAVPTMELIQMLMQWKFDYFLNRGVPEFIFLLSGVKMDKAQWAGIKAQLESHIGLGNSHKSLAMQFDVPEVKMQVEKLGMDSGQGEDSFASTRENAGASIATAHRVPAALAGIQVPGKIGAVNEGPVGLMIFQTLVIGGVQRITQQRFGSTLGAPESGLGLSMKDFAMAKITEEIPMSVMDTTARMKTDPAGAAREGRNVAEGTKP